MSWGPARADKTPRGHAASDRGDEGALQAGHFSTELTPMCPGSRRSEDEPGDREPSATRATASGQEVSQQTRGNACEPRKCRGFTPPSKSLGGPPWPRSSGGGDSGRHAQPRHASTFTDSSQLCPKAPPHGQPVLLWDLCPSSKLSSPPHLGSGGGGQSQGTAPSLGASTHTAVKTRFRTFSSNHPARLYHLPPAGILMLGTPTLGAEKQTE